MSKKNILFLVLISLNCFSQDKQTPALFNEACDEKFAEFAEVFRHIIRDYDKNIQSNNLRTADADQNFVLRIRLLTQRVAALKTSCPTEANLILPHLKGIYAESSHVLTPSQTK
jgi:hypothetical protein